MNRRLGRPIPWVMFVMLVAIGIAAGSWAAARGAAPAEGSRAVVLENERVRVHAISYPPGARGPEHEHTVPRVVVVLEGGSLELRDASGGVKTLALKNGDVVWRPAERHSVANTGTTTMRLVEVDILDRPRP